MNMPIAKGPRASVELLPSMANRHGLIAGATGTGKTVSLQVLAERFSALGVPVFMADVKGDLAGISQPGGQSPKVIQRVRELGLADYTPAGFPSRSGMSSVNMDIPFARRSRNWVHSSSRVSCN